MFPNNIPLLISIVFIVAILFPVFMLANLVKNTNQAHKKNRIIIFYITYLILVTVLCFLGVFKTVMLPPKIILVTTLPLLLFYLLFISQTKFYTSLLKQVKLSSLVRVHIFRLIGSFFLILFFFDQLPKTFAFIAGFGDVITAISSLYVAKAIEQKKSFAKKLTFAWNTFGLIDILLTSATAVLLTKQNMETGSMGVDILTVFPFCYIPAFAPATIIFLHITIYRKFFHKAVFLS